MGYGIRDTGYGIRDTGYGIRDTGYGIRDTGYGIRDTKNLVIFFLTKKEVKQLKLGLKVNQSVVVLYLEPKMVFLVPSTSFVSQKKNDKIFS